ncbi:hypothetical protein LIER_25481 [Lithospermum erythrorhizon]|uniref:Reverse transcriptase domain-containing protein n=1 Tax=Lithospermum erythrorhizon TaxID=34254 RepID=A0AAV3R896_LITER
MAQLRTIAICNTVAKIIAKTMAFHLRKVMPTIISDTQSAFMPHRLTTDNILLTYEVHHDIKHKKSGKEYFMSIKLDMLKAYDRIGWNFLCIMLIRVGYSSHWVTLIMNYMESVTYSLLIFGDQVIYITPGRGLRQGDLLSSYLFIICTKGLISLLKEACSTGELKGIKLGPSLDPMTHLIFADETLLLGCATLSETSKFKSILDTYESWSGQLMNA